MLPLRTATIAASATTSDAIPTGGSNFIGIIFPPAMTGTTLTFKASPDDITFYDLYDPSGIKYTITVTAAAMVAGLDVILAGVSSFKLVSGSTESAVRNIICVFK